MRRTAPIALSPLVAGALLLSACGAEETDPGPFTSDSTGPAPRTGAPEPEPSATETGDGIPRVVDTVASGLAAPWGIAFLPDGSALVTERDSKRVLHIVEGDVREVGEVAQAFPQGEAGLLGIAVSPTYAEDSEVFLYVSTVEDNRVVRTTFDGESLGRLTPILTGIPNGFIHDGGRLAFGPDGHLYVSTGEIGEANLAQDPESLAGKILRITRTGAPAPGNPVRGSEVYSAGHRNVQGLAFDDQDRLWASEFGDSSFDELNLIRAGDNYGWPQVEGRGDDDRFTNPQVVWSTSDASPSGLAYLDGSLWMGALRGERLWRVPVTEEGADRPRGLFVGEYGRIRTVAVAPDGNLWVTTSNRDGRGDPARADDRILVVDPG